MVITKENEQMDSTQQKELMNSVNLENINEDFDFKFFCFLTKISKMCKENALSKYKQYQ